MRQSTILLALLAAWSLWGCPGTMGRVPDQGGTPDDLQAADSLMAVHDGFSVTFEGGPAAEAGAPTEAGTPDLALADQAAPDASPDSQPPDSAAPTADSGATGGKCPCAAPLLCVNNVCRATCTAPTDGCKVVSNCPSNHGCAPTNRAGIWVCIPGAAPGAACGNFTFCWQKYVCAQVNNNPYACLPICSKAGASCGTSGGKCLQSGSCLFCSSN